MDFTSTLKAKLIRMLSLVSLLVWIFLAKNANATNYYTRQNGNFNSNSTWSLTRGGSATSWPQSIGTGDSLFIEHAVTSASSITVNGYLYIKTGSSLSYSTGTGTSLLSVPSTGKVRIDGTVTMHKTGSGNNSWTNSLQIAGSVLVTGTLTMSGSFSGNVSFQNTVSVTTSGKLDVTSGAEFNLSADFGSNSQGAQLVNNVVINGSVSLDGDFNVDQNAKPQNSTSIVINSTGSITGTGTLTIPQDGLNGSSSSITGTGSVNGTPANSILIDSVNNLGAIGYPVIQSSTLSIVSFSNVTVTVRVTKGSGSSRMIIVREDSAVSAFPQDNNAYTANSQFGSGSNLGSGNYVVYSGSDSTVTVSSLTAGKTYHFAALEFNGSGNTSKYKVTSPARTSQATLPNAPSIQASNFNIDGSSDTSISLSWTRGNGSKCLVIGRASSAVNASPTDGTTYSANSEFGSGSSVGNGNFVVYNGTGNSVAVTGLLNNRKYHFQLFEYNGDGTTSVFQLNSAPTVSTHTLARVKIKVFLEGPYTGSGMSTILNDSLPKSQVFNAAPWNYSGTESVSSIPNDSIVDWVLVELRQASLPNQAVDTSSVGRRAGFLLKNGDIVDLDGYSPLLISTTRSGKMYAVVYHRTHIPVQSADSLALTSNKLFFDFTSAVSSAFGNANPLKEVAPGVYAMYCGRVATNTNNTIGNSDANAAWNNKNTIGYHEADVNLDGVVDAADRSQIFNNLGVQTQIAQ